MKSLRPILILILSITLPVTQAYAVVPDTHSVLSDAVDPQQESKALFTLEPQLGVESVQLPSTDLLQVETIISGATTDEIEEIQEGTDDLFEQPIDVVIAGRKFWTTRKLILASTLLLTTGLLIGILLALSGAGSGSSSGTGGVGGTGGLSDLLDGPGAPGGDIPGGDVPDGDIPEGDGPPSDFTPPEFIVPDLEDTNPPEDINPLGPGGRIPHNPEPSTFLLLGLGLLVPGLRKRLSL